MQGFQFHSPDLARWYNVDTSYLMGPVGASKCPTIKHLHSLASHTPVHWCSHNKQVPSGLQLTAVPPWTGPRLFPRLIETTQGAICTQPLGTETQHFICSLCPSYQCYGPALNNAHSQAGLLLWETSHSHPQLLCCWVPQPTTQLRKVHNQYKTSHLPSITSRYTP